MRHEMGTPLTPITGYAELLMMGALGALNAAQQEHVRQICESTNQLRLAVEMIVNEARRQVAASSIA
jgi:signal transduction histidine kinase